LPTSYFAVVQCIFKGHTEGELTLTLGEIITVTSQGTGDGWFEGINSNGEHGRFPGRNVELFHEDEALPEYETIYEEPDYTEVQRNNTLLLNISAILITEFLESDYELISFGLEEGKDNLEQMLKSNRKTSRVYHFTKTEAEPFILGKTVKTTTKIAMIFNENGASWIYPIVPLECTVTNPQMGSKYSGMKKYISYQITPNDTDKSVYHRYKHFDWLHCRLLEKFGSLIAIPLLPEKDIPWRFSDEFVLGRMGGLQAWINRMSRHPVVAHSDIFQHFIRTTDVKEWKIGKRIAEKDEAVGGMIFAEVMASSEFRLLDGEETEMFLTFVKCLGESIKNLTTVVEEHWIRNTGTVKSEYHKIGKSFLDFSASFAKSKYHEKDSITSALAFAGKTYNDIGDLYSDQPKENVHYLLEISKQYKGLLSCYPDIINVLKGAIEKAHEYEKLAQTNKVTLKEKEAVVYKAGIVSSAIQAEMNHFNMELSNDYKETFRHFLYEQVQMYNKRRECYSIN
uniref:Sorting nexin-9-like n=1 Tax=Callorhinchus milii TaxID=7868 RepID=A0A4W3IKB9_CALMI